jgi:tetratricopeptide (TPR) repeat protein
MALRLLLAVLLWSASAPAGEALVSPEAKLHVAVGIDHYNAGRYQEAVKEFELAYRLSSRPALLFNIARAESKLGHEEAAIAFLRRYLEERPNAPDAQAVRAEIEAHGRTLAEQQAKLQAERDAARSAEMAARAEAEAQEARRRADELTRGRANEQAQAALISAPDARVRRRKAGMALTIAGALVVVTGVALGIVAAVTSDQVSGSHGDFNTCCAGLELRGRISTGVGIAFDVLGGAAAATGVALWVTSR